VKSELQVHLNALKGYVDMKFDVLKGMLSGAEGGKGEGDETVQSYESKMQMSMDRMEAM